MQKVKESSVDFWSSFVFVLLSKHRAQWARRFSRRTRPAGPLDLSPPAGEGGWTWTPRQCRLLFVEEEKNTEASRKLTKTITKLFRYMCVCVFFFFLGGGGGQIQIVFHRDRKWSSFRVFREWRTYEGCSKSSRPNQEGKRILRRNAVGGMWR